ncbi:MAG: hypothetical protein LKM36_06575 [Flavobacteriales bacterium]|jgi:hypothetical protein|nr:hypothetical protein [Flavobacteriales bacterium]
MTTKTLLRFVVLLTTISACFNLIAQSQTRFNYQAQIRSAGDAVLPNAPVDIRVSIRMGANTGEDVYREVHSDTTSSIGLVNILVGAGTVESGDIDAIAWGDTTYYLKVDVDFDDNGLFDDMGGAPIVSVPIAEYARNGGKPWSANPNGIHYTEGYVGVGNSTPLESLHVTPAILITGDSTSPSETRIQMKAAASSTGNYISSFDVDDTRLWVMDMADRERANALTIYSEAGNINAMEINPNGAVEFRANGHSKIDLYANANLNNYIQSFDASDNRRWLINMGGATPDAPFKVFSEEAGESLLLVQTDGVTQVKCLEILGGCDINERFNSTEFLEPGTVVIANSERPGEVCMTDKPYDQRVVGAISGANGIRPGLTLTQKGTSLDGTHPVALDGRVYVRVAGAVQVGDLLTTSSESGRAMAAKNRKKAFGAVIGKALESDADGDGLVLMLVQPR